MLVIPTPGSQEFDFLKIISNILLKSRSFEKPCQDIELRLSPEYQNTGKQRKNFKKVFIMFSFVWMYR